MGVGAPQNQAAQPDHVGNPRPRCDRVVLLAQGLLARVRLPNPHPRPAQRLLGQAGPQRVRRSIPPFPGCDANRRMHPHVRWCGGRRREPGAYPIPKRDAGAFGSAVFRAPALLQSGCCLFGARASRCGDQRLHDAPGAEAISGAHRRRRCQATEGRHIQLPSVGLSTRRIAPGKCVLGSRRACRSAR
jgi:hypothetical protein